MIRIYRDIVHFTELDDKAWTSFEFESLAHGCDPTIKKRICFVYVNTTGPKAKAFVWFVYLQDGQPLIEAAHEKRNKDTTTSLSR
jgi:hypothetical protein